jgi:hypothetical protein
MKTPKKNPCDGCGGEDCVCCEVWLERRADERAAREMDPADLQEMMDFLEDDEIDEDEENEGTAEPAERPLTEYEMDTPLGREYGDGFDPEP